jgi:hypothetical protein
MEDVEEAGEAWEGSRQGIARLGREVDRNEVLTASDATH